MKKLTILLTMVLAMILTNGCGGNGGSLFSIPTSPEINTELEGKNTAPAADWTIAEISEKSEKIIRLGKKTYTLKLNKVYLDKNKCSLEVTSGIDQTTVILAKGLTIEIANFGISIFTKEILSNEAQNSDSLVEFIIYLTGSEEKTFQIDTGLDIFSEKEYEESQIIVNDNASPNYLIGAVKLKFAKNVERQPKVLSTINIKDEFYIKLCNEANLEAPINGCVDVIVLMTSEGGMILQLVCDKDTIKEAVKSLISRNIDRSGSWKLNDNEFELQ